MKKFLPMLKKILNAILVISAGTTAALICAFSIPFYAYDFYVGNRFQHWFGQAWIFFLGIRVTVKGLENIPPPHTGGIVAPNHESMFDIPLLASIPQIDMRWVAKQEVRKIPILGTTLKAMKCFFVKRDKSAADLNVMKEVEDGVRDGYFVLIFPEGTRTRTGELLPLKKGAFRTAQNSGKPLLPVAISGTYQIAKPGKWPEYGHSVTVNFGKPIFVPPDANIQRVMEEYREILIKLLSEDR